MPRHFSFVSSGISLRFEDFFQESVFLGNFFFFFWQSRDGCFRQQSARFSKLQQQQLLI
jgi:hypothetical protein